MQPSQSRAKPYRRCRFCRRSFQAKRKTSRFCDKTCFLKQKRKDRNELVCKICGNGFYRSHKKAMTCGAVCYAELVKANVKGSSNPNFRGVTHQCAQCPKMIVGKRRRFCGDACYRASLPKKKEKSCTICGKVMWLKPSIYDDTVTCSRECQKRWQAKYLIGPRATAYMTGSSSERALDRSRLHAREWRDQVLKRDDWTCQFCGKRGGRLEADHIKPYSFFPDCRWDVENGRTLCRPCHKKTFRILWRLKELLKEGVTTRREAWEIVSHEGIVWPLR